MSDSRYLIPALEPVYTKLEPFILPLLRVTCGGMLISHGWGKLFGGLEGTAGFLASAGYEPAMVWAIVVALTETVGGAFLVVGLLTRPAAFAVVIFMINAFMFHWPAWIWLDRGVEMPLLWGIVALVFVIKGGGAYSVDSRLAKEI
ncbi:MAG: DoxX family protein [Sphingomonadales bacterium]